MLVRPLICPEWHAPPNVRALVTTRHFGDMARGAPGRQALQDHVPREPVWLRQVHGIQVADADATRDGGTEPQADAAVAREPGTVCAVLVADCMPVLFADVTGKTVGVAHAGWRGLCAGVLEATLSALGAPPEKLLAWLGPAIGPRVYEVGDEVREAFVAADRSAAQAFAAVRPGHWLLDLYAIARQRLQAAGVARIEGGGFCTYSEPERFFSYRRDHGPGRMAALIWLA
jgi:hypothetical protein